MIENFLVRIDNKLRYLIATFLIVLSIGFYTGIRFIHFTTSGNSQGISQHYLGNEDVDDANVMKFKKSNHEMLNITHTHIMSMSIIFLLVALLVYGCPISSRLKCFLMIEPLLSVLFTFGSIYLLWQEISYMSYVIMISGTLMVISYTVSIGTVMLTLLKFPDTKS